MLVTTIPDVRIIPLSRVSLVPAHFLYPSLGGLERYVGKMGELGIDVVYCKLVVKIAADTGASKSKELITTDTFLLTP